MSDPCNDLGWIWYHSEPWDVPIPQASFLVGTFFAGSYSKTALVLFWRFFSNGWGLTKGQHFVVLNSWQCNSMRVKSEGRKLEVSNPKNKWSSWKVF